MRPLPPRRALDAIAAAILLACAAAPALAQGTGRSLDFDPSIRSAGMGSACNAVFWGADPDDWGNPALLGYVQGVRFEHGRTQLVPGVATDVFLTTNRTAIGASGVGLSVATGIPWGLGETRLDYGLSEAIDSGGNVTGIFDSYERSGTLGMGVSVGTLLAALKWPDPDTRPSLVRHFDVALGMNARDVKIVLAPAAPGGTASGRAIDWGALLRAGGEYVPGGVPIVLDAAYGYSVLGANDSRVTFINEDMASPLSRIRRSGLATHIALPQSEGLRRTLERRPGGWLLEGLDPIVSFAWALDWEAIGAGNEGIDYNVHRWGIEFGLGNVIFIRTGHVTDRIGNIIGGTSGYGLQLPIGRFAGVRWDHAEIPQARDAHLPDVKRDGYVAWCDPWAIAEALRSPPRGRLVRATAHGE